MNHRHLVSSLTLMLAFGAVFCAGYAFASPSVEAQGLGSRAPSIPPLSPANAAQQAKQEVVVYPEHSGTSSASSDGMLAVTGSYGVGTSVLYVIDTATRQLAVYEARGGSRSTRRLTLVGARRIDLDLKLHGYNDESEYPYAALEKMFASHGRAPSLPASSGAKDASADTR